MNYKDVDAICPSFDKVNKGYVQCEGIMEETSIKLLFHDMKDGHPLDAKRDEFFDAFCSTYNYKNCPIYKMINERYGEDK